MRRTIEEAQVLRLALEDQQALAAAILSPPEPNDALRRARHFLLMPQAFRIAAPGTAHDRAGFSRGADPLDRCLKAQASQDMRRRVSNCFVALPRRGATIAGFYTLTAASIPVQDLPDEAARRPLGAVRASL